MNILTENKDSVFNTPLFGKPNSENSFDGAMLKVSNEFILSTERLNNPLCQCYLKIILSHFISCSFFYQGYLIHTPCILFSVCLFYFLSSFI